MTTQQPNDSGSSVRWRRVYIAVGVYTAVVVALLWFFWRIYAL